MICNICGDEVFECNNCGDKFKKGDTIFCSNRDMGSHYCIDCPDDEEGDVE